MAELSEEKIINDHHLKLIMDEYIDTLKDDIVIKNNISSNRIDNIIQKLNTGSKLEQKSLMHYLYHYFSNYGEMCNSYLRKIVKKENEKKKIEKALRCYLPWLINGGYSQEYIYHYCNVIFADNQDGSLEMLDNFLNRFDFKKRSYSVYIAFNKKAEQFKEIFTKRLNAVIKEDSISQNLRFNRKKFFVARFDVDNLDECSAARQIYENVNLFIRFYKFLGDRKDEWLFKKCLVNDKDNNYVVLDLKPQGYSFTEDYDDMTIGYASETVITTLLKKGYKDFPLLNKAMELHDTAIENNDMKDAFLNFWSVLEIIGITKRDNTKISEIEKSTIPILQNDYAHIIIEELYGYLKENMNEDEYNKIMQGVSEDGDEYFKISCIVVLDKYKNLRQLLYDSLQEYPLIRSRISQLNSLFKTKKGFYDALNKYTERIRWHIQRLYRTRNAIIHSGDTPDNLKPLGEHLHSYVDELLYEIIVKLTNERALGTVNNVLIDVQFHVEDILKVFNSKEDTNIDDLRILMQI